MPQKKWKKLWIKGGKKLIWLHDKLGYLRKSRQDDPNETIEEVLSKHEARLQEFCELEFGGRIPPENIFREIISGESIDARVEIRKVLARIEDPAITGVVVIEPSRLSRGDLADCAKIITAFRFTGTQVVTPMMTYNLENKMERKFFQDELLRGNDYLEYTKSILFAGRVAAVKRGCYIGNIPPYGYNKIKIGKDSTLEPNADADVVRLIYKLYVEEGLTPLQIARRLNEMGIPPLRKEKWQKTSVSCVLQNPHYIGKVFFNKIKGTQVWENGEIKKRKVKQAEEDVIMAEGKHPAIVDLATWEKAQEIRKLSRPRVPKSKELANPLSGLIVCHKCGRHMVLHPYSHTADRFECREDPRCYKSIKNSVLFGGVIYALENAELPALKMKVKNGDGDARKIQERLLAKLEKQMEEFRDQEEKQYDLLETGKYSQDVFDRRNAALRAKMEECQAAIYKARTNLPKNVDYAERVVALEDAIAVLKNPEASPSDINRILKAIVKKIEFTGEPSIPVNDRKGRKRAPYQFSLDITLRL